jgi:hypothetical protein
VGGSMTLTNYTLNTDFVDAIKDRINVNWLYGAIGTGTATENAADTSLGAEYYRKARQQTTTTSNSRTVSLWVASTEGNGSAVGEIGFFDESGVGNGSMWVRHKLDTTINKNSDIEMWFDVQVTISCTQS